MEELNQRLVRLEGLCQQLVGQKTRWSRTHQMLLCGNGHPLEKGEILGDSYLFVLDRTHLHERTDCPQKRILQCHHCDGCGKEAGFASPQDLNLCVGSGGYLLPINDPYFYNRKNWRTFMCCPLCDFDLCEECYTRTTQEKRGCVEVGQRRPEAQTFPDARNQEINELKAKLSEVSYELWKHHDDGFGKPTTQNNTGGGFPTFTPQQRPMFGSPSAPQTKAGFFPYAEHLPSWCFPTGPPPNPNLGKQN